MPITLITGCSSRLGLALAHALRKAGHEVWATVRRTVDGTEPRPELQVARGSWLLPFLAAVVPRRVLESALCKAFDLHRL